jgi:3'-phosphoadenosine 5'-phosphosulfate sulfotransferase (PAPS reductase)/FAD synthetase
LRCVFHVVSVSGGKDSDETLRQALARFPKWRVIAIYCDTGNEHEAVDEHLAYLEVRFGIKIIRLSGDFSAEIRAKRFFVARDQRTRRQYKKVPRTDASGSIIYRKNNDGTLQVGEDGKPIPRLKKTAGRQVRWTNKAKRRAMAAMFPRGNPFLDLCIWKGRFPSRKAQFCTQELKTMLAVEFQQALVDAGHRVVSWQGVRRDESLNRRNVKFFERTNPRTYAHRPLADKTALWVFASLAAQGVEVNALYRQGMGRVGCMPCINQDKAGIREMAMRWPKHARRISEWEHIVGDCSKLGYSTMMADAHPAKDRRQVFADLNIWARIEWSKTTRGGKQLDLLADAEPAACASSYGLCDQGDAVGVAA